MKFFWLAYFVAKKGEKMIYLSLCMLVYSVFILQNCLLCLCFAYVCITIVAFILQLSQILCRCSLLCYNILMLLMMIWDSVLSNFILYMFLEHVWCNCRWWHLCLSLYLFPATILYNYWNLSGVAVALVCCCWCCNNIWSESSQNLSIVFWFTCSLLMSYIMIRTCLCVTLIGLLACMLV